MLRAKSVKKNTPPFSTLTKCNLSPRKSLRICFANARILPWIRAAVIRTRTLSLCWVCSRLVALVLAISSPLTEARLYLTHLLNAILTAKRTRTCLALLRSSIWRTSKIEKQIPHPAKTAGIRDDRLRCVLLSIQDVKRAKTTSRRYPANAVKSRHRLPRLFLQEDEHGSKEIPGSTFVFAFGRLDGTGRGAKEETLEDHDEKRVGLR